MRISDWSSDVCSSDLAQTSPATFYVYFKGVPEVVLAALEGASQTSPELEAITARDWLVPGADEAAAAFVECYTDLWNRNRTIRSEEHTSELQSLMRISYAVFCLKKKTKSNKHTIDR